MFAMPVAALVMMGFTVKGIVEGDSDPDVLIPELLTLVRTGGFPLDKLVKTWPLAQIDDAVVAQHRGECVKAVLIP
jgi:aryl-alcohol dehydrogenase